MTFLGLKMIIFGHFSRFLGSFEISFSSLQHPRQKLLLISTTASNETIDEFDSRSYCDSSMTVSAAKESERERLIVRTPNSDRIKFSIEIWHNEYDETHNRFGISKISQLFEQSSPEPNFPYVIELDLSANDDLAESTFIHKNSFRIMSDSIFDVIPNLQKRWSIQFDLKVIPDLLPQGRYGQERVNIISVRPQYSDNVPLENDSGKDDQGEQTLTIMNKEVFPFYSVQMDEEQRLYLCFCKNGNDGCSMSHYNLMGMRLYRDNEDYYQEYQEYYKDSAVLNFNATIICRLAMFKGDPVLVEMDKWVTIKMQQNRISEDLWTLMLLINGEIAVTEEFDEIYKIPLAHVILGSQRSRF